jgi:hypothetical protein
MKNRDENTTIILFSYNTPGFFVFFFNTLVMNSINTYLFLIRSSYIM